MKKVMVLCISICFVVYFLACGNIETKNEMNGNPTSSSEAKSNYTSEVDFKTGIYQDIDWEEPIGTYQGDAIPNHEVALCVATEIFNGMDKRDAVKQYVPQSVFYDEQDEIWIVSFYPEYDYSQPGPVAVGEDCCIALQKKDGKVLRIWFGE